MKNIEVGNDMTVDAGELNVLASEDTAESKSSSSSSGVSVGYSLASGFSVSANTQNGRGNGEGTSYNNTTIKAGGDFIVNTSGNATFSGANVEADELKLDIGGDLLVESKQDYSVSENKSSGGGITLGGKVTNTGLRVNTSKGESEKLWVTDQTSIIAKNGGTIEAEDGFTNRGAIIGSESEADKLLVKADTVTVENLKDKIQNETKGGGFDMNITRGLGPRFPSISIVDNEKDKRQDTNATAINTEFVVAGEKKSSEELGLTTDLEKAQVITKDEEHSFSATLPTDLLNKEVREQVTEGLQFIGDVTTGLTSQQEANLIDKIKENMLATIIRNEAKEDKLLQSIEGKPEGEMALVLTNFVNNTLEKRGYEGEPVLVAAADLGYKVVGDAVVKVIASSDETTHTIYLDTAFLAIATTEQIIKALAHEWGHFAKYDNLAKNTESTAKHIESKVKAPKISDTDLLTQEDYATRLGEIAQKYQIPSVEDATEMAKNIPYDEREDATVYRSIGIQGELGATMGYTIDGGYIFDLKKKVVYKFGTITANPGVAFAASINVNATQTVLSNVSSMEELLNTKYSDTGLSVGVGKLGISLDILQNEKQEMIGSSVQLSFGYGFSLEIGDKGNMGVSAGVHSTIPSTKTVRYLREISAPQLIWKFVEKVENSKNAAVQTINGAKLVSIMDTHKFMNTKWTDEEIRQISVVW